MSEEACCLFSLCECWMCKLTERRRVEMQVYMFALTSALSCVCLQSGAPASPNAWGRTGIWSCSLQGASPGRSRRSRLEDGPENQSSTCWEIFGLDKSSTWHRVCGCQRSGAPACGGRLNVPGITCVPSCHAALPRMTLMLIFLCKEELTRQPIFNSSAPPSEDMPLPKHCAFSDVGCAITPHVCCLFMSITVRVCLYLMVR